MLPEKTDLFDILFIIKVCMGKVMTSAHTWHKTAEYPRDTTPAPSEMNVYIYIWVYTQLTLRKQFERRRKEEKKNDSIQCCLYLSLQNSYIYPYLADFGRMVSLGVEQSSEPNLNWSPIEISFFN